MIKLLDSIEDSNEETSVALGCFDGLHLGHKKVITKAIEEAGQNLCPTVFTFSEVPRVKINDNVHSKLITFEDKVEILSKWGIKQLYSVKFTEIMNISAEEFVCRILRDKLNAKKVICGFNYHFGNGRKGDASLLKTLCNENGIEVYVINPVRVINKIVSSTSIRDYIKKGKVEIAKELLGRHFSLNFAVVEGKKLGKLLGTPTLNQLFPKDFALPKFGVYASNTYVGNNKYWSVTNIGVNPTTGDGIPKSETWMPKYTGKELYGEKVKVELVKYLREEKKFSSLDELKEAIINDSKLAEKIIKSKELLKDGEKNEIK